MAFGFTCPVALLAVWVGWLHGGAPHALATELPLYVLESHERIHGLDWRDVKASGPSKLLLRGFYARSGWRISCGDRQVGVTSSAQNIQISLPKRTRQSLTCFARSRHGDHEQETIVVEQASTGLWKIQAPAVIRGLRWHSPRPRLMSQSVADEKRLYGLLKGSFVRQGWALRCRPRGSRDEEQIRREFFQISLRLRADSQFVECFALGPQGQKEHEVIRVFKPIRVEQEIHERPLQPRPHRYEQQLGFVRHQYTFGVAESVKQEAVYTEIDFRFFTDDVLAWGGEVNLDAMPVTDAGTGRLMFAKTHLAGYWNFNRQGTWRLTVAGGVEGQRLFVEGDTFLPLAYPLFYPMFSVWPTPGYELGFTPQFVLISKTASSGYDPKQRHLAMELFYRRRYGQGQFAKIALAYQDLRFVDVQETTETDVTLRSYRIALGYGF